eukprot:TRINITY_DN2118_c0_g6_i6.p1 TRINITY_DN2118_c0_g6~~TRINITY_DN2118_c0_g6_i6.p1  ORF type:complete len:493 (+),score=58.95 TRINITY_DN2118_c0_g6_i6:537-2015(+)
MFGEGCLKTKEARPNETVVATTTLECISFSREDLLSITDRFNPETIDKRNFLYWTVPHLEHLRESESQDEYLSLFKEERYTIRSFITKQGNFGSRIYFLFKGVCGIYKNTVKNNKKILVKICDIGPGTTFGEEIMKDEGGCYLYNVKVESEEAKIFSISVSELRMRFPPQIADSILENFAGKERYKQNDIGKIMMKQVLEIKPLKLTKADDEISTAHSVGLEPFMLEISRAYPKSENKRPRSIKYNKNSMEDSLRVATLEESTTEQGKRRSLGRDVSEKYSSKPDWGRFHTFQSPRTVIVSNKFRQKKSFEEKVASSLRVQQLKNRTGIMKSIFETKLDFGDTNPREEHHHRVLLTRASSSRPKPGGPHNPNHIEHKLKKALSKYLDTNQEERQVEDNLPMMIKSTLNPVLETVYLTSVGPEKQQTPSNRGYMVGGPGLIPRIHSQHSIKDTAPPETFHQSLIYAHRRANIPKLTRFFRKHTLSLSGNDFGK